MIKNTTPLSMTESLEYLKDKGDNEIEIKKFVKKFVKMKPAKAKEMRKKLESLDLMKMNASNIAKIIDIMPDNSEGLSKIFNDLSLNEDETKNVLEAIEEFR